MLAQEARSGRSANSLTNQIIIKKTYIVRIQICWHVNSYEHDTGWENSMLYPTN
jgi:hypothetical protein